MHPEGHLIVNMQGLCADCETSVQVLASYFVLTPLRDEISVQLGTSVLPKLFVASVAVNVLAQSMTAHVLAPAVADRGAAIARLFAFVATVLLAFATAVAFSGQFASGLSPHTGDHGIRHLLQGAFQSAGRSRRPPPCNMLHICCATRKRWRVRACSVRAVRFPYNDARLICGPNKAH